MAERIRGESRSVIRQARECRDAHPEGAGLDRFGHGRHADGIGTEGAQHADFGGCFVFGSVDPGVDPFSELHADEFETLGAEEVA